MIRQARAAVLCIGSPTPLPDGKISSIDKRPVDGPIHIGKLGLKGDHQSDRRHHGGEHMAVHHYPADHYPYWREQLPDLDLLGRPGAFGENIAAEGLVEAEVCIGDRYRFGTALLEVSMGRQPCSTLERHFQRKDMVRRIVDNGKCGWYYRVIEDGEAKAGDALTLVDRAQERWSIATAFAWLFNPDTRRTAAEAADLVALPALGPIWRDKIAAKRI